MSERFARCETADCLPVQSKSPVCLDPDCREKSPADCQKPDCLAEAAKSWADPIDF